MNTTPEKPKGKSYKSKKKYDQREETKEQRVKDAGNSQNQCGSQNEKLSAEKDHYNGIEHHHYLAREKRRKSRSERNKRRERRKQIQQKIDPKEQSEFRKHVRRAQEITSRSSVDHPHLKTEAKPISAITQNRLTRKLGLFNQGKKSSKILRDAIIVPESVQSRVERDLKEILSHKSSTEAQSVVSLAESYKSLQWESKNSGKQSHGQRSHERRSNEQRSLEQRSHQSCCLPTTPSSVTKPSPSRSWATTSPESLISGISKLPKSPPWEEISKEFEESLDIEMMFPDNGDYLNSVYDDLRKLIETYGSSQDTRLQGLAIRRTTEIPQKISKLSVRRRLEDAFIKEAEVKSAEVVGRECPQSITEKSLKETSKEETGLTKLKQDSHRKKKVVVMGTNQVIYKRTSTEELMNAMMDGLQFLKNADEVNKIWSNSRSRANSEDFNEVYTSKSDFYQGQGTSKGTGASERRHRHGLTTERHHREAAGYGQECFTSSAENGINPVMGLDDKCEREWNRACLDHHHLQGKERLAHVDHVKSDLKLKVKHNVAEDIFDSSTYHNPRMSPCHATCAPLGNSPLNDVSHDSGLMSPLLRRRRHPHKRFRMMESSDTDEDEDDDLLPSWYMEVDPPKLSTIEPPKFYPQKMF